MELSVELPVSDGADLPGADGIVREPLIEPHFRPQSVYMATNPRFVPTVYTTSDSDPMFSSRTVLGIKLIPRSGRADATIELKKDGRTNDASVRIAAVPIAPIVKPQQVQVAKLEGGEFGAKPLGVCKIVLREKYDLGNGVTSTVVTNGNVNTKVDPRVRQIPLWALKS